MSEFLKLRFWNRAFGKDVRNHVGGRFVFEFDYVVFYLLACEMIFGIDVFRSLMITSTIYHLYA